MADKTASMTVIWSLTGTFTIASSASGDSDDAKAQALSMVQSNINSNAMGVSLQQVSLESDSVNYMITLTGENSPVE
jgi:hypothetical protein